MTSTIWTFGGGAAAAETFLFAQPPNNRRLKATEPRTHSVVARFRQSLEPLLLLARPTFVENLTASFEVCHCPHITCPSCLSILWSESGSSRWTPHRTE